jgi:hypothetical protein
MARFLGLDELFEGWHIDCEIVVLCVRWYLRFKLSLRNLVEMMAERGFPMAHTRWKARPRQRAWRRSRSGGGESRSFEAPLIGGGTSCAFHVTQPPRLSSIKKSSFDMVRVHNGNPATTGQGGQVAESWTPDA